MRISDYHAYTLTASMNRTAPIVDKTRTQVGVLRVEMLSGDITAVDHNVKAPWLKQSP